MGAFMRTVLWECLLCIVTSVALSYTLASVFYASQPFQTLAGLAGMVVACGVLTVALFASTFSTKASLYGALGIGVAVVGCVVAGFATSSAPTPMEDVVGNNIYIVLVVVLSTLAVFFLTRRKLTSLVLVVLGIYLCALVEYLYWYGHVVSFVVFALGAVALFAVRSYRNDVSASEGGQLAFGAVAASGAAITLVAALVAGGLFVLVVSPLHPQNVVVKLVTEHYRVDEVEVRGIASTMSIPGDTRTSQTNDQTSLSSNMVGDRTNAPNANEGEGDSGSSEGAVQTPFGMLAALLLGLPPWAPFALLLGIVALVAAVIGTKLLLRKRRYNKMLAGGNERATNALYLFFLERFKRLDVPELGSATLGEYVRNAAETFNKFESGTGTPDFATLTNIYTRNVYGGSGVADAELGQFKDYYHVFYKRMRKFAGTLKYARMFMFV